MGACQSKKSKEKNAVGQKWWAVEREAIMILGTNPRGAISKFETGLEIKSKDPVANELSMAKSYICIGIAAAAAKLPSAKILEHVEKALPILETHDKTLRVITLNLLASSTAQDNEFNLADKWAKECLEYATANFGEDSKEVLCGICCNGLTAKLAKKFDDAVSWFEKAIPISTKQPALDGMGMLMHMMGGITGSEDPLDGLIYSIRVSTSPDLPTIYYYMGETMLDAGNNDKGYEYFTKEMDAAKSLGGISPQTHKITLNTLAAKHPSVGAKIKQIADK